MIKFVDILSCFSVCAPKLFQIAFDPLTLFITELFINLFRPGPQISSISRHICNISIKLFYLYHCLFLCDSGNHKFIIHDCPFEAELRFIKNRLRYMIVYFIQTVHFVSSLITYTISFYYRHLCITEVKLTSCCACQFKLCWF